MYGTHVKMPLPTGLYRADHVGSLLRDPEVLKCRREVAQGDADAVALCKVEDTHISQVVKRQLRVGLRSITDGEYRRAYFHLDYLQRLDGIALEGDPDAYLTGSKPPALKVTGKLSHPKPIQVDDFKFLQQCIDKEGHGSGAAKATPKVCVPSPTMAHFRGGRDSIDKTAYPELEPDFFDDLARVYQEEIANLYAAGARFVQLDDTNLAYLCDQGMRQKAAERDDDPDALTKRYVRLINAAIKRRPSDMTVAIHLCRGNYKSKWFASGGYEPVAKIIFKGLNVDAFFLEYDDARSGDFAPLRHLPAEKYVVLGVMSSKKRETDDKDMVKARLREAAGFVPRGLEQICLSHQCGFSSTMEGNELTAEEQWRKLAVEVEIAGELWGSDLAV